MPVVSRLSTTPVKGTALHSRTRVELTRNGVEENRRFHLVDARHRLINGKQQGPLVRVSADDDADRHHLSLRLPGREPVEGTTTSLGEPVVTTLYGGDVPGHLVEGPWASALSEFVGEPVHLVATDAPGAGVDLHPVTLVSTATIEHLSTATDCGEAVDHRRFRMLVEVDGCDVREEDTWAGRRVRLGAATVRMLPQDPTSTVARLPEEKGVVLGMYAIVEEPGTIAVGDRVEVVDPG
ncbi:MOSC domain-containing protein [Blastococcus sp. CCUG 61487]|uniref:MOSC N-terminal beta barrel domain-containing protein n=1 Tax=Blastococcus sp. CCUG 61487 TaxID=1840703 RepID=UPI00113D88DC|nr:MOSC domain-containing protein [Blastococcus sp. CCUG 61487]TKJ17985.1 hypothetical protein A6V29_01200 [Blastococcus sp. CCUG 61487]